MICTAALTFLIGWGLGPWRPPFIDSHGNFNLHKANIDSADTIRANVYSWDDPEYLEILADTVWNNAGVLFRVATWHNAIGRDCSALGQYATVGGGWENYADGDCSVVGGGYADTASGIWSTVGGGAINRATGIATTVSGGQSNVANDLGATVGGGISNVNAGLNATIGGGLGNEITAAGISGTVGGGMYHVVSGISATIGGGQENIASGVYSTVSGGHSNYADGDYSVVGGGRYDTASGEYYSTVGGGYLCRATAIATTVGGGDDNIASGHSSTVAGGVYGRASGNCSFIGGGESNATSGNTATVSGGYADTASGDYSTIPGGYQNLVEVLFGFATGYKAKVWGDASDSASMVLGTGVVDSVPYACIINGDGDDTLSTAHHTLIGTDATVDGSVTATSYSGTSDMYNDSAGLFLRRDGTASLTGDLTVDDVDIRGIETVEADSGIFSDRVGIGTTNPTFSLDIAGVPNPSIRLTSSGSAAYTSTIKHNWDSNNAFAIYTGSSPKQIFGANNVGSRVFIPNGNVGIGTTGPDRKLDVLDASAAQARLTQTDNTVYTDLQTTSTGKFIIDATGDSTHIVGLTQLDSLDVASRLVIPSGTTPSPDVVGAMFLDTDASANGSLYMYGNGAWRKIADLP